MQDVVSVGGYKQHTGISDSGTPNALIPVFHYHSMGDYCRVTAEIGISVIATSVTGELAVTVMVPSFPA